MLVAYSTTLTDWTANDTVTQALSTPYPPTYEGVSTGYSLERISVTMHTAGADADGAITMKVQKVRGGSGGTTIDVTGTFSLEAAVITTTPTTFDIPILDTLTPAQFMILAGDALILSKVNDSAAIDTQPVGVVTVECAAGA